MFSKFKAKKIKVDDMVFDSKREYQRYLYLVDLENQGKISNLQRQVKFEILPKQKRERAVYYIADFVFVDSGVLVVEDVKSKITKKQPEYVIKRKLLKFYWINDLKKLKNKFEFSFNEAVFQEIE